MLSQKAILGLSTVHLWEITTCTKQNQGNDNSRKKLLQIYKKIAEDNEDSCGHPRYSRS